MFNKEDILARLRNGESQDAIAQEMADALNSASDDYRAETEAKAAEIERENDKVMAAKALLENIVLYFEDYYPKLAEEFDDLSAADFIDILDILQDSFGILKNLEWAFSKPTPKSLKVEVNNKKAPTDDEVLQKWIKHLLG